MFYGVGTLDELFAEEHSFKQIKSVDFIVLVGSSFWEGLIKWIKNTMLKKTLAQKI